MTKSNKKSDKSFKAKSVYNTNARLSHQVKKEALESYVQSLVNMKLNSNKKQNRLDHHHYDEVHSKIQAIGMHWLTPSALKSRVIRAYKVAKFDTPPPPGIADHSSATSVSNDSEVPKKAPGRPQNTSLKDIQEKEKKHLVAKKEITQTYFKTMMNSKANNEKQVQNGTYKEIVKKTMMKYHLDSSFSFNYHACMARIYRKKEDSLCTRMESPLKHVEEKFVAIILALSDIGSPLTVGETMALIQSLIEGTSAQKKLIEFQKRLKKGDDSTDFSNDCLGKISTKYYYSFMRRHKDVIESNKGR